MNIRLAVARPFDGLDRGDLVTDPTPIAQILNREWAHSVVQVLAAPARKD